MSVEAVRAFLGGRRPVALIVLGSGLGDLADHLEGATRLHYRDIPGFPIPTVEGHKGELVVGRLGGRDVLAQAGRFHMYEGHDAATSALCIRTAAALGVGTVLLTNAAGGIRRTFKPGTLMLIADHVNMQFQSPLIGAVRSGEIRFPDMSDPYDRGLRDLARDVARERGVQLEEGVYAGLLGPSYETPAEVRMLERLGADAVGMSTVAEVIAARALGLRCLGISTVTNLASGIGHTALSHAEVMEVSGAVQRDMVELFTGIVAGLDSLTHDSRLTTHDGMKLAQAGMLLNMVLAIVKVLAGIVGHSYALIADGIESVADIFGSLIVWSGLRVARRSADSAYPFGYGKAEALAAAAVGFMLVGAAIGISIEAIREIMIPHHTPAPFTLAVLVGVVLIKELFFRRVSRAAAASGSTAVQADAWHHRSDAITSLAAFIGIGIALIGGPGWEQADDGLHFLAACVIVYNGVQVMRPALQELMDRAPGEALLGRVERAAHSVTGVLATEKLKMRRAGTAYYVDLHVQADPTLSLHEAHILSGMVKSAIRREVPEVSGALIHMEPFEDVRT